MQIYLVGGAVRDTLLGRTGGDRDWVVVGATPDALVAQGYLPVGKDFPVFLHPRTHEEYALARTERKTAPGYHGFAVHAAIDVTLEQDLARRDLTINSIAASVSNIRASGQLDVNFDALTDPFGGQRDLQAKVLRHVTDAFREDPVRILRVARFAARFADFTVASETIDLMRQMVAAGEVDALVSERVWQELARGLMEPQPSRMFAVLRDCGALARLLPEVDALWGVPQRADYHPEIDTGVHVMAVLDMAARLQAPLPVRFACLTHDLGKATVKWGPDSNFMAAQSAAKSSEVWRMNLESAPHLNHIGHEMRSAELLKGLCQRLRVPTDCRDLADVVAREHGNIHRGLDTSAAAALRLLERADAFRKPQRFVDVLLACECDARGRLGLGEQPYLQRSHWLAVLQAAQSVATEPIATAAQAKGVQGKEIGGLVHAARVAAIQLQGICKG